MKIKVKLVNEFRKYGKNKLDQNRELRLEGCYTVEDILKYFEIPEEKSKIVLVNGRNAANEKIIKDGDEVVIYNLIAGG